MEINTYWVGQGILMRDGNIMNATISAAQSATKDEGGECDPDTFRSHRSKYEATYLGTACK